jgi:hypothetical protein
VPLHFINADIAPGVKLGGGMVSHTMNDIDVKCLPADLPAFIEVDLKDLAAGQSIHVSQLVLPKGVEVVHHGEGDPVVASIIMKGGGAAEEAGSRSGGGGPGGSCRPGEEGRARRQAISDCKPLAPDRRARQPRVRIR